MTNHVPPLHARTPLLEDIPAKGASGAQLLLKMECSQPAGSFKIRGIGHMCQRRLAMGAGGFVSSSGGNAGLAVAYAGHRLQARATVVVPASTPLPTRDLLARWGARVEVHGDVWDEADLRARELAATTGDVYIPPFDDPLLWEGHASLVDEIPESLKPTSIVVSVGGGGLLCGVIEGLRRRGWSDVRVIAVETEGAASLNAALRAGQPVTLDRIDSIAKSLGARRVGQTTFDWARQHDVESVVVSDRAAVAACVRVLREQRVLVEPACGAALAVAYERRATSTSGRIVAVVCGGVSVDLAQLRGWCERFSVEY